MALGDRSIQMKGILDNFEKSLSNLIPDLQARLQLIIQTTRHIIDFADEYKAFITDEDLFDILNRIRNLDAGPISEGVLKLYRFVKLKVIETGSVALAAESDILAFFADPSISKTKDENWRASLQTDLVLKRYVDAKIGEKISEKVVGELNSKMNQREQDLNALNGIIEETKNKINELVNGLSQHEKTATNLMQTYNFVGLANAFVQMEGKASFEKWVLNIGMFLVAGMSVGLLVFAGFSAFPTPIEGTDVFDVVYKRLISIGLFIFSAEILLVYFFRVLLKQQQSAKAQLLQLRLRHSLCAFIESYSNFSEKKPRVHLDKFEALIFSGLTPDPNNVPSTFDGLESLVKIWKSVPPAQ